MPVSFNLTGDTIDSPCLDYIRMYQDWELYHDLLGGTRAMRAKGEQWLPKEPREKDQHYKVRLHRSVLFNAYKDTIKKLTSKPFGRPATVEELPPELESFETNMDLQGSHLTAFCRDIFKGLAVYGITHLFVDFPTVPQGLNRAQEEALGARPFFRHVRAPQLFYWDSTTLPNGKQHLTEIRFRDMTIERKGAYGSKRVHWIYVYRVNHLGVPDPEAAEPAPGVSFEIWRSDDGKKEEDIWTSSVDWWQTEDAVKSREYTKVAEGPVSFEIDGVPTIPLITVYGNRKGYMVAEGPLDDLAWMNLVHWQSMSDQRNILRFARLPQLFASGFTKDDLEEVESMSVQQIWRAKDPAAKLAYVEHSGKGVQAGQEDLNMLKDDMKALGMQPLMERTQDRTATGVAVNESRSSSDVLAWIEATEGGVFSAFEFAANWVDTELTDDFAVNIYSDFSVGISGADMEMVLKMREQGDLSRPTMLREAKRRGFLSDELDVDEEEERILEEAAAGLEAAMNAAIEQGQAQGDGEPNGDGSDPLSPTGDKPAPPKPPPFGE